MNSLSLALTLSLLIALSIAFRPAAHFIQSFTGDQKTVQEEVQPEIQEDVQEEVQAKNQEEAEIQVPELPGVPPSSQEGNPVTCEARLPVLMYHHVVEDGQKCNEMTVTVNRLEQDLQWLTENGYQTVLPRELAAGQPLPEKPILITFDDGYRSNYELAYPLFQKYQVKAVIAIMVYMPDCWAESFLSWDMCREMTDSGLVEIGSHGFAIHNLDERNGSFIAGQPNGVQRQKGESDTSFQSRVLDDLQKSYDRIAAETGDAPTYFAYPFGQTDPDADAFIKNLFPVTAVTGSGKYSADLSQGLYNLPRFAVTMKTTLKSLLKKA